MIYMITKFRVEYWDQNSNVKVHRPRKDVSGHVQTFPPGDRNLQDISYRLRGSRAPKQNMLGFAAYAFRILFEETTFRNYYTYPSAQARVPPPPLL